MLSKSQISFIKSLHQKKYRKENGLFLIEGIKSVQEFIHSGFQFHSIYHLADQKAFLAKISANIKLFEINNAELDKISTLQSPQGVLAVVHVPSFGRADNDYFKGRFSLALDQVQDPGNLGTIIRTADWFGIRDLICAVNTVEAYNPKTVQATMGSLARVRVHYLDLEVFLRESRLPVFGTLLQGENIYETQWGNEGIILLGNEGNGISDALLPLIDQRVTIPRIGAGESLNVAISAAICCSELRRKK